MHFPPPPRHRVLGVLMAVGTLALAGCSAAQPGSSWPSPVASRTAVPAPGGLTLGQLGFTNGPRDFSLPEDIRIVQRVDQPNVVTLVMDRPTGTDLAAWLRQRAREQGVPIAADAHDALVYDVGGASGTGGWAVAFTGGEPSGLTLRRRG